MYSIDIYGGTLSEISWGRLHLLPSSQIHILSEEGQDIWVKGLFISSSYFYISISAYLPVLLVSSVIYKQRERRTGLLRWYCCEDSCSYLSTIQNLVSSLGSCITCQSSVYRQLPLTSLNGGTYLLVLSVDTSSFD